MNPHFTGVPALRLACSSGPHEEGRYRGVNKDLFLNGWDWYFASPIELVKQHGIKYIILDRAFGDDFAEWPDGTAFNPVDGRRQSMEAYRNSVRKFGKKCKLLSLDSLMYNIKLLSSYGCSVIHYVGPPDRQTRRKQAQYCYAKRHLDWVGQSASIIIDGAGTNPIDDGLQRWAADNSVTLGVEPIASERVDPKWYSVPSLTLSQYTSNDLSDRIEKAQGSLMFWLDNLYGHDDASFWPRYAGAIAQGFYPVLPMVRGVWESWVENVRNIQESGGDEPNE